MTVFLRRLKAGQGYLPIEISDTPRICFSLICMGAPRQPPMPLLSSQKRPTLTGLRSLLSSPRATHIFKRPRHLSSEPTASPPTLRPPRPNIMHQFHSHQHQPGREMYGRDRASKVRHCGPHCASFSWGGVHPDAGGVSWSHRQSSHPDFLWVFFEFLPKDTHYCITSSRVSASHAVRADCFSWVIFPCLSHVRLISLSRKNATSNVLTGFFQVGFFMYWFNLWEKQSK